jgi:hypothetical protein
LSYAELERFYKSLVTRARRHGITCAITSGMACVAFGVSETTKDCDLLCVPDSTEKLLDLLSKTTLKNRFPKYRGGFSAPLDTRWLRGGWTSHFAWETVGAEAYLDVFGIAPRASSSWEAGVHGFYASPHTVAEMKRTNRERDWPLVTALGAQMLRRKDPRGWLHIFDAELLQDLAATTQPPRRLLERRPVLQLAIKADSRLRAALHGELQFWHELDRARLQIYQRAVRPYWRALRASREAQGVGLKVEHETRVRCAVEHLPTNPLADYGISRMISEARESAAQFVNPSALQWLPDVTDHFNVQET